MAVLREVERFALWSEFMAHQSNEHAPMDISKSALRDAIDAVDDWVEGRINNLDAAFPMPARTALTDRQKTYLLFFVARARAKVA